MRSLHTCHADYKLFHYSHVCHQAVQICRCSSPLLCKSCHPKEWSIFKGKVLTAARLHRWRYPSAGTHSFSYDLNFALRCFILAGLLALIWSASHWLAHGASLARCRDSRLTSIWEHVVGMMSCEMTNASLLLRGYKDWAGLPMSVLSSWRKFRLVDTAGVPVYILAVSWPVVIHSTIHFVLFADACCDTHRYIREKRDYKGVGLKQGPSESFAKIYSHINETEDHVAKGTSVLG